ncbi:hypothetical protein GCM10023319_63280 [Nocardia iowensis]
MTAAGQGADTVADEDTRVTELDRVAATWYVRDGVIHVLRIRSADVDTVLPNIPTLGQCFNLMPRTLWERVRYEYEQTRPRGGR